MSVRRLCHPKKLLILYFISISVALLWVLLNFGSWCPTSTSTAGKDTVFPHLPSNREHLWEKHELRIKLQQQKLEQWESRLRGIETELRRQYPLEVNNIIHLSRRDMPWIFAVTPTYARPAQKAELTRLIHTFLHVPNFHWIVVEDAANRTALVTALLAHSGLLHTHLNVATPREYKMKVTDPNWLKPRGVLQRNLALDWIHQKLDPSRDQGVVYFADDDNTYALDIFEEMRLTQKVSVWPVGLVGYLRYESPIVHYGRVTGFFTYWRPDRPFPIDMAGFAVNVKLLLAHPDAVFSLEVQRGYQESIFLSKLVSRQQLEPLADNCTKVLVWHTRTENPNMKNEAKLRARGLPGSDPNIEV